MRSVGNKGLLQHGHSLVVTMVVTATGDVLCAVRTRTKRVTEHQSHKTSCIHLKVKHEWEKSVLYEITAEAEEIAEHLEPMTICFHRHNN